MANIGTLMAHLGVDTSDLKRAEKDLKSSTGAMERGFLSLKNVIAGVFAGLGVYQIVQFGKEVISLADNYTLLGNQLKLVTSSSAELNQVQGDLQKLAADTRVGFESTLTIYARMARATQELGVTSGDLMTVTRALNEAVIISGVTSQEANAALIQLSQGMASGTLRGEELRSVMEQLPAVAMQIAKGMGIPYAKFREMAFEGKVTTEAMINALKKQAGEIHSEFSKMEVTIGQAWTNIGTNFGATVNDMNQAISGTSGIASVMQDFADWLREFHESGNATAWADDFKLAAEGVGDAISLVTDRFVNLYNAFGLLNAVADGQLSFWEAAAMGPEEASKWLKQYNDTLEIIPTQTLSSHGAEVDNLTSSHETLSAAGLEAIGVENDFLVALENEKAGVDGLVGSHLILAQAKLTSSHEFGTSVEAVKKYADEIENLKKKYTPVIEKIGEMTQAEKELKILLDNKIITDKQYAAAVREISKSEKEATRNAKDHADAIQDVIDTYLPLEKESRDVEEATALLKEALGNGAENADRLKLALDNLIKSTPSYKQKMKEVKKQVDKIAESYKNWEKKQKENEEFSKKSSEVFEEIYDELVGSSQVMNDRIYESWKQGLEKQINDYRVYVKDEELLNQYREKRLKELYVKWATDSDNFFAGFIAGHIEAEDAMKSLGEVGKEVYQSLSTAFSDTFVSVMKGEFDSIGDIWKSLLDNMLNIFIKFIADLIAQWVMSGIVGMITGAFSGGWSGALGGLLGGISGSGGNGIGGGLGSLGTLYSGYQYLTGGSSLLPASASGVSVGAPVGASAGYAGTVIGSAAYEAVAAEIAASAAQEAAITGLYGGAYEGAVVGGGAAASEGGAAAAGGVGAGVGTAMVAGVFALGISLWARQMMKEDIPSMSELMNNMGVGPDAFAYAMGDTFKKGMNPVFGGLEAFMMDAESSILTRSKRLGLGIRETADSINDINIQMFDSQKGMWVDLGKEFKTFEILATTMGRSTAASMIEAKSGVVGLAEELINITDAQKTSLDIAIESLQDMGVEGEEFTIIFDEISNVISGVSKDTSKLKSELKGLGLASDQVGIVIEQLGLDVLEMENSFSSASGGLRSFVNTVGTLDYGLNDLENALGDVHNAVRTAADGMVRIAEDTVYNINDLLAGVGDGGNTYPSGENYGSNSNDSITRKISVDVNVTASKELDAKIVKIADNNRVQADLRDMKGRPMVF